MFFKFDHLFFDPTLWWWLEAMPFFAYSAKEGGKWITKQMVLKKTIPCKWRNEIPPSTSPKWNVNWHKAKAQKEVAFFWYVKHKLRRLMNGVGNLDEDWQKLPPLRPAVCGIGWTQVL